MRKIVNILWTGGWDSTFRVCELSRMDVTVQPIYVVDENRKSKKNELHAIEKIVEALMNKKETLATILPIKQIGVSEIPENKEISDAYKKIHDATMLGSQHEWLARLALQYPGIEIGTEAGSVQSSRILKAIDTFGKLTKNSEGIFVLDAENSTIEGKLVLGNLSFPIIEKTEIQMLEEVKEMHYEDVMSLIWFCHNPVMKNGKTIPCGICHPCQVKIASDMGFLFPSEALKRGLKYKKLHKLFGERITNKLFAIFGNR